MIQAFLIAALSADGFIARSEKENSLEWTSSADKAFFKERTKQARVVIMGSKTFSTIGAALPGRLTIVYSRQKRDCPNGVEVTSKAPRELLAELGARGYTEAAICGGASIYTLFAKAGCLSRLYLTVEPVAFGRGIRLFNDAPDLSLKLTASKQLDGGAVLLEYEIKNTESGKLT